MRAFVAMCVALVTSSQSTGGLDVVSSDCDGHGEWPVRVVGVKSTFCMPFRPCEGPLSIVGNEPLACPRAGQRDVVGNIVLTRDSCCAVVDNDSGALGCVLKKSGEQRDTVCLPSADWLQGQDFARVIQRRSRSKTQTDVMFRSVLLPAVANYTAGVTVVTNKHQTATAPVHTTPSLVAATNLSTDALAAPAFSTTDQKANSTVAVDNTNAPAVTTTASIATASVPTVIISTSTVTSPPAMTLTTSMPTMTTPVVATSSATTSSPVVTATSTALPAATTIPPSVTLTAPVAVSRAPMTIMTVLVAPMTALVAPTTTQEATTPVLKTQPAPVASLTDAAVTAPEAITYVPKSTTASAATFSSMATASVSTTTSSASFMLRNIASVPIADPSSRVSAAATPSAAQGSTLATPSATPIAIPTITTHDSSLSGEDSAPTRLPTVTAILQAEPSSAAGYSSAVPTPATIPLPSSTATPMPLLSPGSDLRTAIQMIIPTSPPPVTTKLPEWTGSKDESTTMTIDSAVLESPSSLGGGVTSPEVLTGIALGSGSTIGESSESPIYRSTTPDTKLGLNESATRGGDIVGIEGNRSTLTGSARSRNGLDVGESSNDTLVSPSNIVVGMANSSSESVELSDSSLIGNKLSSNESLESHTDSAESRFGEIAVSSSSSSRPSNSDSRQSLLLPSSGSLEIERLTFQPLQPTSSYDTLQLSPITDDSGNSANPQSRDSSPSPVNGGNGGKSSRLVSNSMLFIIVASVSAVAFVFGVFYLRPKRTNSVQLTLPKSSAPMHFLELEPTGPYDIASTPRALTI